jgi:hypothetical protein
VPSGSKGEPKVIGAALQRTCARVSENVRDAMGDDGWNALLARAITQTESAHPVLSNIRRFNDGRVHLDRVVECVEANGAAAVTEAIEALFATLVDILGRLIGEDMAIRLIDPDASRSRRGGGVEPS